MRAVTDALGGKAASHFQGVWRRQDERRPHDRVATVSGPGDPRKILFISYHFPPSAAVGGQRVANFAGVMRAWGWEPHVLTIPDRHIETIDRGRMTLVEGIRIHKAPVLPTILDAAAAAWTWVRRALVRPRLRPRPSRPSPSLSAEASNQPTAARSLRRCLLSFLVLPDANRGWCLPATVAAIRTIRRERVEWIMTSCPPYSAHLVGLGVKLLTGRRWVADFRDPWMTTGSKRLYPTSALSLRVESWLERLVIERADLVVFNVDRLRHAYQRRYASEPADKFVFIPNGIPAPAGAAGVAAPRYERFTICYTGSLYVGRSPEPVFGAVSRLIKDGVVAPGAIRVMLVGHCRRIDGRPTDDVIAQYGLESVVDVQDSVPYSHALDMVRRSHLALLLAPNLPYQVPAKVYDYLGAGTRILAIAEEGGTADLLRETGAGCAFRPDDIEAISKFIVAELTSPPGVTRPIASLDRFDVGVITEDLAGHLSRLQGVIR